MVFGRSGALPEVFASKFEPHQPEGLALSLACRAMKCQGTCAGSSGLFGLGYLSISRRLFLGLEYLYDYVIPAIVPGLATSGTMTLLQKPGRYRSMEHTPEDLHET